MQDQRCVSVYLLWTYREEVRWRVNDLIGRRTKEGGRWIQCGGGLVEARVHLNSVVVGHRLQKSQCDSDIWSQKSVQNEEYLQGNVNWRSPILGCDSSWNRDGIQLREEDQKKGSILYLKNVRIPKQSGRNNTHFAPSIWRIGPDMFSMKSARTRILAGLWSAKIF